MIQRDSTDKMICLTTLKKIWAQTGSHEALSLISAQKKRTLIGLVLDYFIIFQMLYLARANMFAFISNLTDHLNHF